MTRRQPLWRLALLLVVLAAVVAAYLIHLPKKPDRSTVGLQGHMAAIGVSGAGSPWPEAMHDAAHTGTSATRGPQTGHVRWSRTLEHGVTPGPVIGVNGDVIVASDEGILHALDPRTGEDVWTYDSHSVDVTDLSVSPAVLPSGVVVWGTAPGLVGLSPAGALLWRVALHGGATSPALTPGGLIVGDQSGWVYDLAVPATGRPTIRWSVNVGDSSYGSVSVSPGGTIFQTVNDAVVAISAAGRVAWRHALPTPVEVSPAATPDGGVVTGAGGNKEYGLDRNGKVRWTHDRRAQTYSSPVVTSDGLAAFGDHAGIVTVVDAVTGKLAARYVGLGKREYPRTIGIWSSPVIDRDHDLYVATYQGHLQGWASDGQSLFDLDSGSAVDSYPALTADGGLVVADTGGTVRYLAAG